VVRIPILLLGSLVRHVVLVPGKQRGEYVAHVREANDPLIEAMIEEALKEPEDSARDYDLKPHFVLDYEDFRNAPHGELHSILDYFARGATSKLKNDQRLRVRHEQISSKTLVSKRRGKELPRKSDDPVTWFFDNTESGEGSRADSKRQIMVLYDHDPYFRALVKRVSEDEVSRERFARISSACEGGVVLAINDHEIDREQSDSGESGDLALNWFRDSVELCFKGVNPDRSVVIVSADALRKCGLRIAERGAVESSVNDIVGMIQSDDFNLPGMQSKFRHLVMVFREPGALYIDLVEKRGCVTFGPNCDRHAQMHPAAYGRVPGKFTSMVTSVVRELCWTLDGHARLDVEGALRMAVAAYNYHYDAGFMESRGDDASPFDDYIDMLGPTRRANLMKSYEEAKEEYMLTSVSFSWSSDATPTWSRLDRIDDDFDGKLIEIVQYGLEEAFREPQNFSRHNFKPPAMITVPYSKYGSMKLVDPEEIERFSSLAKLLDKYLWTASWSMPLSIAVFGAPGSGKSFAVKQIIARISPDRRSEPLVFNLAQFASIDHLTGAFHKVQDMALFSQEVPLVVFDEFDADFEGRPLGWLKYFLAPMQDGIFRGKEADYRVGRAIFLFAGGTSSTFDEFKASGRKRPSERAADDAARQQSMEEDEEAKRVKLPDFVSRLRGHLDVAGVNPLKRSDGTTAPIDRMLMLRRAILLRSGLERNAKEIFRKTRAGSQFANIHEDLIRAFVHASHYEHGSRSMEAIIQMSRFIDGHYVPTSLPMEELLRTHVDAKSFMERIGGWRSSRPVDR
jgi:hypothetical protein